MELISLLNTPGGGTRYFFQSLYTNNINNKQTKVLALLDSGSTITCISSNFVRLNEIKAYEVNNTKNMVGMFSEDGYSSNSDCSDVLINKCCFITLHSICNNIKLIIPAIIIKPCLAMQGADILIGGDNIGPNSQLGLNIPLELNKNINLSFWKEGDKNKGIITFNLDQNLGDRMLGVDLTSSGIVEKLEDESEPMILDTDKEVIISGNNNSHISNIDKNSSSPFESAQELRERVLKNVGAIDTSGWDPTPETMKLLVELKVLRKELDTIIIPDKLKVDSILGTGKHTRKKKRISEDAIKQIALLEERRNSIEARIKVIQQRLSLKRKKYRKRSLRVNKKLKNISIKEELKTIPRYNNITSKLIEKPFQDYHDKVIEIKEPLKDTIRDPQIVALLTDIHAEASKKFSHSKNKQEAIVNEIAKKIIPLNNNKEEHIATIKALITEEELSSNKELDWIHFPKDSKEPNILHSLEAKQQIELNDLIKEFESTLVSDEKNIAMGMANPKFTFDCLEFKPGGREQLDKRKNRVFPIKKPIKDLLQSSLLEMEQLGVGVRDSIDTTCAFPGFMVKRPRSDKLRLCVDYSDLNDATEDIVYPLPRIDDIVESMLRKSYFSIIDLKSGYWQIPLSERAKKLCSMITQLGTFTWHVLPFGLKQAPPLFQKMMNTILQDSIGKHVFVYLDDIVIFSNNFDEHLIHLRQILSLLKENNLKANISKCHFCLKQLKLLGRIVSEKGISTDPSLIEAMVNFPTPKSQTNVRSFLALCNHYRDFINHFADMSEPLSKLTRKTCTWVWGSEQIDAFDKLKQAMISTPVLAYPDWDKPFHMQTDASLVGAGAVLLQTQDDNKLHPVAYASWLFNSAQRNYPTQWRELLAFVLATRKWKPYFYSRKFTAETDHKGLEGYLNLEDPHGKVARWHAELLQFNYKLTYLKGELNVTSDSLSRNFEDKVTTLTDLICGISERKAIIDFTKNPSKYIAEAQDDLLVHEIVTCVGEYNCVTNIQRLTLPNDEEWAIEQRNDEEWFGIITWIESGKLPSDNSKAREIALKADSFVIKPENNILYRRSKINETSSDFIYRRCVPKNYRKLVLAEFHDSMWSGAHLGRDKTYQKIRENFYFTNMFSFVSIWCNSCSICQKTKGNNSPIKPPIGIIDANYPMDLVSIDLWDAGQVSRSGNKYVLSIIDVYSKFAWARPIPIEDEETVANALIEIFCIVGFPVRLHSDRGTQFTGKVLENLCKLYHVTKSHTTAYHPQGNGTVERLHQFFKHAVSSFVNSDHRNWDEVLRFLLPTYNSTMHEALGVSPSEAYLGRKMASIGFIEEEHKKKDFSQMQYVQRVKYALNKIQTLINERKEKKIQKNFDLNPIEVFETFEIGDKVSLKEVRLTTSDQLSNKLKWKFTGPYEISKKGRDDKVYYLKDQYGDEVVHPVSVDRLRRWIDRSVEMNIEVEVNTQTRASESDTLTEGNLESNPPLVVLNPNDIYTPTLEESKEPIQTSAVTTRQQSNRSSSVTTAATDPLIGKRIRVKWPSGYFYGTVIRKCITKQEKANGSYIVLYEDDNQEYFEHLDGRAPFDIVSCLVSRSFSY